MTDDVTLYGYVRVLANTLGLTDWEIELEQGCDLPSDCLARVHVPTGRRIATIKLGDQYETISREDQRATLVHELLHCHFDPLTDLNVRTLPDGLGAAAWDVFQEAHELLLEQAIDATAVAVAEFLPCPPEGSN